MSESPPPTALPARVAALKIKETSDRRKSLPAPQPSQPPISRKRRKSESASAVSRPMRKPRQAHDHDSTITVLSEDEVVSDTDSEPLSDPPSESDSDIQVIDMKPHEAMTPSPSTRSASATPVPIAPRQGTRASTRTQPPRNGPPPSSISARIRGSVAETAPSPLPQAPEPEQEVRRYLSGLYMVTDQSRSSSHPINGR
jgi:hypothetical protein